MIYLLPTFQIVSVTFAVSAVITGFQAIIDPVRFSNLFGLPMDATPTSAKSKATATLTSHDNLTKSYISLMGVRQLGTGIILLTFAFQRKWNEMATILAVIGIVVAGTDGVYLARGGTMRQGLVHAVPGAIISLLASWVMFSDR